MHHLATTLDVRRIPEPPGGEPSAPPDQWALPLDGSLALEPVPVGAPASRPALSIVTPARPTGPSPEVLHARASRFVQALVEVAAGDRPAGRMMRWMAPRIYTDFVDRLTVIGRARTKAGPLAAQRGRVASVHVHRPSAGTAEIAARVVQGRRSRAIALRLEVCDDNRARERWMCTALTWG